MGLATDIADRLVDGDLPSHPLVTGLGHPILDRLAERVYARAIERVAGPWGVWLLQRAPVFTYTPPFPEPSPEFGPDLSHSVSEYGPYKGSVMYYSGDTGVLKKTTYDVVPPLCAGEVTSFETNVGYGKVTLIPCVCSDKTTLIAHYDYRYFDGTPPIKGYTTSFSLTFPWPFVWFDGKQVPYLITDLAYPPPFLLEQNPCGMNCVGPLVLIADEEFYPVTCKAFKACGKNFPTFLTDPGDNAAEAYAILRSLPLVDLLIGYSSDRNVPNHYVWGQVKPPSWALPSFVF